MAHSPVAEIEAEFARLSTKAQLRLLERLLRRVRVGVSVDEIRWKSGLRAMAGDAEIQNELRAIDAEFRLTESDGLERQG